MAKDKKEKSSKKGVGINKPIQVSKELGEIVGTKPQPRGAVIKKLWEYIKGGEHSEGKIILLKDKKLFNLLTKEVDDSNTILSKRVIAKREAMAIPEKKKDAKKKSKFKNPKAYKDFLASISKSKKVDMMKMNALLADHMSAVE